MNASRIYSLIILTILLVVLLQISNLTVLSSGQAHRMLAQLDERGIHSAVPLGGHRTVAATTDNRLLLIEDGAVRKEVQFTETITALAVSAAQNTVYAGTSDRTVWIVSGELNDRRRIEVNGRVTGIGALDDGGLAVAHGVGQYTDKYWISVFGADDTLRHRELIGFDISALTTQHNRFGYATEDTEAGVGDSQGVQLWRKPVPQTMRTLAVSGDGSMVAGDQRGGLHKLDAQGRLQWTLRLSGYPLNRVVAVDGSPLYAAGDAGSSLFLLSEEGELRHKVSLNAGEIRAIYQRSPGELEVWTQAGQSYVVQLDKTLSQGWKKTARMFLHGVSILLLLAGGLAVVYAKPEWKSGWISWLKRVRRSRTAYLLLLPAFAMIVVFEYVPTLMALVFSFSNFSLSGAFRFIGLDNFRKMASDPIFWMGMKNMGLLLFFGVLKAVTMPLLVAELVFWLRSKGWQSFFRASFVLPYMVPGIVITLLWRMMYEPESGMINQLLSVWGLSHWRQAWLGEESVAIWSIIFQGFPYVDVFAFLIYYGGLIHISSDIFESASMDGIKVWQRFRKIDLPLLLPQISLVLFFTFINTIQGAQNILIMTQGGPGFATYVPGLQMYFQIADTQFGYASAIGFVLAAMVLVLTVANNRLAKRLEG